MWIAVNHNTNVTSGEKFDIRNVLHGQVSLAAVNQICIIHEAINSCKNLKIYQRNASTMHWFYDMKELDWWVCIFLRRDLTNILCVKYRELVKYTLYINHHNVK